MTSRRSGPPIRSACCKPDATLQISLTTFAVQLRMRTPDVATNGNTNGAVEMPNITGWPLWFSQSLMGGKRARSGSHRPGRNQRKRAPYPRDRIERWAFEQLQVPLALTIRDWQPVQSRHECMDVHTEPRSHLPVEEAWHRSG